MPKDIRVISTSLQMGARFNKRVILPRVVCDMSDGSTWSCLEDGTDWQEAKHSDQFFTEKFRAAVKR